MELSEFSAVASAETPASGVSQTDLLAFAEAIPVIMWRTDARGLNDYLNAAWYAYTGSSVEQSRGSGWALAVHPDDRARTKLEWREAVRTGAPFDTEYRLLGRDGAYRWFLVRGRALRGTDGAVTAWFGTSTDVDTQKRAAEAMTRAKNRAELLAAAETVFERSFAKPHVIGDLAELAIDTFATFCYYDSADEHGELTRRAAVHRDPTWQRRFDDARPHELPWRRPCLPPLPAAGGARLIAPVSDAWLEAIAADAGQLAALRALEINSVMAVPLMLRERNYGVLTFGRSAPLPPFTAADLELAQELAHRAAATLENAHAYALARENERRAAAIADAVPQIFFTARADGSIDWFNRRWYEYTGKLPHDSSGLDWASVQHPRELPDALREWRRSLDTGTPFEMSNRLRGIDGVYRWFLTRVVPQLADDGAIARWYGATTNVDSERRATLQLAFFAELGQLLTSLPSLDATLDAVVASLVPNFADWAMVELHDDDGATYVAAAEHATVQQRDVLRARSGRRTVAGTTLAVAGEALRSGRPVIGYSDRPAPDAGAAAFTSAVAVPLIVDADVRGVLTLAMVDTPGAFSDADLPFVQEIGRRIAPALARAEIYERERRIAQTFQSAVLPRRLPAIPGLRFDALYEPGKAEALVGGDWFDAFRLADGRIVITIGDVVGSGLAAATAMGEARQSIRGAAAINPDPAILLDAADRILADNPEDRFATAWAGIVDPIDFSMRFASAGHPAPLVRAPGGAVQALTGDGLPLGLAGTLSQRRTTHTTFVEPGSLLLLYTDGLIESTRDAIHDERVLADALAATPAAHDATARELRDAVLGADAAHDDVAILLVEFVERLTECGRAVRAQRWSFDVTDAAEASAARRAMSAELKAAGLSDEHSQTAELIVAELLGNVVRYASGSVDLIVDCSAEVPVIHIIDGGTGFEHNPRLPADTDAESGRGLFIVNALAREFTIARAPGGGSHARVVLETRAAPK